jgi:hypothetical protein
MAVNNGKCCTIFFGFKNPAEIMIGKRRGKPALDQGEVGLTIRSLAALNWLNVKASSDLPLPAEEAVDA